MPTISSFYGVIIIMHHREREHNPPHIHAVTAENEAAFDIRTAEMISKGVFPRRAKEMVVEFIEKYEVELMDMWECGEIKKLDPIE